MGLKTYAMISKTEDIEPGDNLGRGMIYEIEKPSCEKAMSLSIQCKSRKRINVWKL